MDRNTVTGLILIISILILFGYLSRPSQEEIAAQRRADSIRIAEMERERLLSDSMSLREREYEVKRVLSEEGSGVSAGQPNENIDNADRYGVFAASASGKERFITLENNLMKVLVSNKGGRVYSVELKNYKAYDGSPLVLFNGSSNRFGLNFFAQNRTIQTNDLYFNPLGGSASLVVDGADVSGSKMGNESYNRDNPGGEKSLVMRLEVEGGGYIDYTYTISHNSYMLDFNINSSRIEQLMGRGVDEVNLVWQVEVPAQERGTDFERRYAGVYYKHYQDEVDYIKSTKNNSDNISTKVEWVAFKDQFFSSVFIAKEFFKNGSVKLSIPDDKNSRTIMDALADMAIPFGDNKATSYAFYFGPNDFSIFKGVQDDVDMRKLVYLGWGFLRYINLLVIKVFHFFEGFVGNYGIIILLLTILIKLILFPLTYKSYISTARMRVLKPQIDEINAKIPKDKAMERQQATMALYRKAGVNPMGGCIPLLLQMPILFAMFQFFPASIELRQESFLWAQDLSSYDAIVEWKGNIPFITKYYGNHISLFCLLMTITNIVYSRINQEMSQSSQQMPGMKGMMYIMPIMFLVFFNNYASGLSYYYFISTLITIGQTVLIRRFVDEGAILAKLNANQKKPRKKSGFQKRLEDMARERSATAKKRRKR